MMGSRSEATEVNCVLTRRQAMAGATAAVAAGGLGMFSLRAWAAVDDGITHTTAAIHQEAEFTARRQRVYEALTNAKEFGKVIGLSSAMKSGALAAKPAEIDARPGGAFVLFGGYISGRNVELVPNERIVQAWRTGSWAPGIYSIARFELVASGAGTRIVLDHTGFPSDLAEHLAAGWKANYWEPLEKFLTAG
jgi:uncharacterized protein YndB with AHSA1/START domain